MTGIAYLVSDHDAPSHTFVRREIAALRERGVDIIPFSVRPAGKGGDGAESLLGRSPFTYLAALAWGLFRRPRAFVASWLLACQHRGPGGRALIWAQFHFVEAILLGRRLHDLRVRHLHNHFANSGATVGMLAARFAGIPWSLTLHGISETDYPAGLLLAAKIERAAFVACASYFMQAQEMRVVGRAHWAKMRIVRCGVDLRAFPAPETRPGDAVPRLICVGRLSPEKGYFGLLDALAGLAASAVGFDLVIVGDGPSGESIRAAAAELGLVDHIRFAGALSETETLAEIARSDILVLPSLMEGLPVVLVEAMALGRPVVASRVAGIPELVEDDESGYLFTPSDWDDLETRLRALLAARGEWARMGRAGRQRVEDAFQAGQAASRMSALFESDRRDA